MQQASAESALRGSHAQGSGLLQSQRSGIDPLQVTRTPVGRPKKRERTEITCDPVKQQRIEKSGSYTDEKVGSQKTEAPSLVGKDGGLSSVDFVERLVCIMTYEWNDSMQKPVDLMVRRTMLAKVVAATVELDCLFRFLKLGGLSVLDRWLQEVYTSRPSGEKQDLADADRAMDDLLSALLGALERLPVDLFALKSCSIGKSVYLLRGHKHPDIQRRARKLVDTWKKRVESEMELSGEARPLVEQVSYRQQVEAKASAYVQVASHSQHAAPVEYAAGGRGKYASVASLCSSPESQNKASTVTIPMSCSVETFGKSIFTPSKSLTEGSRPVFNLTPLHSDGGPQKTEDGRPASSACPPGPYNNQMRVAGKNSVGSKHRKSSNLSISNASSVATALSGSVFVSKEFPEQGPSMPRSVHGASVSSAAEVCNLPCCSFFQDNSVASDRPSRSALNSASSCVADCKEKSSHSSRNQQQIGSKPLKTGIQILASIAASESSTGDVKSPDSPSVRSAGQPMVSYLKMDTNTSLEGIISSNGFQLPKAGVNLQEREHFDRNSSTVSSPETSTHDKPMWEIKRASAACENVHSPADTTSETSLPSQMSKDAGRKRGASTTSLSEDCRSAQALCDKSKKPSLPSAFVVEAVGESSIADKDCKNRVIIMPEAGLENSMARKAFTEASCLPGCSEEGSLEAVRQGTLSSGQTGMALNHRRSSSHGNPSHSVPLAEGECLNVFASVGSKQSSASAIPSLNGISSTGGGYLRNTGFGMNTSCTDINGSSMEQKCAIQVDEAIRPAAKEETQRPVFDLNEMLTGCEEGPVQAISNVGKPMQGFSMPISDALPSLPVVPMTPIAVVAAANGGPFTLPAIACCRPITGEPGWKGSAATSAFRPTQPRRNMEKITSNVPEQYTSGRAVLGFDLNVVADSNTCAFEKNGCATGKLSCVDLKVASVESATDMTASLVMSRKACERVRASWDLNQADEAAVEIGSKLDFDLNNGPIVQDNDDVVLAAKHIRMKDPLPSLHSVASSRLPIHSISPITPILMPAYAMPHSDIPYPTGGAMPMTSGTMPWVNGRPHDGLLQYNIFMQNPSTFTSSGLACSPSSSIAGGPFQAVPFGLSSAPMQGFSAPCGEPFSTSQLASHLASTDSLAASHTKPSDGMGGIAEAIHQQGMAGFWNRPNLDLNAGPDTIDPSYAKDDRRQMRAMNEQMRARPQVIDMAAVLQQRDQGLAAMAGSMQGVSPLKQSIWR